MKLYTKEEFETMINNANSSNDLKAITRHIHEHKLQYPDIYILVQSKCIDRMKQLK